MRGSTTTSAFCLTYAFDQASLSPISFHQLVISNTTAAQRFPCPYVRRRFLLCLFFQLLNICLSRREDPSIHELCPLPLPLSFSLARIFLQTAKTKRSVLQLASLVVYCIKLGQDRTRVRVTYLRMQSIRMGVQYFFIFAFPKNIYSSSSPRYKPDR